MMPIPTAGNIIEITTSVADPKSGIPPTSSTAAANPLRFDTLLCGT